MRECLVQLDLEDATFSGQDRGSQIGFTAALLEAPRFRAIVAANAGLSDPSHVDRMAAAGARSPEPEALIETILGVSSGAPCSPSISIPIELGRPDRF